MQELFDEDFDALELAEGALVLNQAIDPETQVDWATAEMQRLLKDAESVLVHENQVQQRFDAFLRLFYHEWGFQGDKDAYFDSANAFLDKVLQRRKGIPVSLGALLLYFGKQLGFPVEGITFPTQFVVMVRWPDHPVQYVNPFNGEFVSEHTLRAWLVGQKGPFAQLKPNHLKATDHPTVIGRWLALIKSALLREERYALALRCTDLALMFAPDDPYEIRDRGFIYQQLDCHLVASSDYQYFIEQCPEDPAADLLKNQVRAMSQTQVTLH
ncbi:SirB1 family protein [Vibrio kasasachensis]|uniref:SirB1 family protein n=1 Tax=Vibrio kasasachensis TaxID=2910248 RepID=UPI003D127259